MLTQTTCLSSAPGEGSADFIADALAFEPELAPLRASAAVGGRVDYRNRHYRKGLNLRRVLAMALTATFHIALLGALLLPDTHPVLDRAERPAPAAADASDRLTLFVELDAPVEMPPPPPQPPPPVPSAAVEPRQEPVLVSREPPPAMPVPTPPPALDAASAEPALPALAAVSSAPEVVAAAASSESRVATPTATAPSIAPDVARRERDAYIKALMAALLQQRTYPAAARKAREQGVVHLRFTLDRTGQVLASKVQRGAGALLDAAALEVLQRAAPLPPIPASMGKQTVTITVPIEYSLTTR